VLNGSGIVEKCADKDRVGRRYGDHEDTAGAIADKECASLGIYYNRTCDESGCCSLNGLIRSRVPCGVMLIDKSCCGAS
jgi:hypothetical protein